MKLQNLRKIVAFFLFAAICLSMSACCCVIPLQKEKQKEITVSTQATTEPQIETAPWVEPTTEAPVPETTQNSETDYAAFMEKAEGIWIFDGYINHMYDDQYSFEALVVTETSLYTAVYPGGIDRPGVFEDIRLVGEDTYLVSLVFEAGEYMGDYLPESRNSFRIALSGNNKMALIFEDGSANYLTYGGATFEEANITAGSLA